MKFLNSDETKCHYGLNDADQPALWIGIDPNPARDNWTLAVDENNVVIFQEGIPLEDFISITALGIFPIVTEVLDIGSDLLRFKNIFISGNLDFGEDTSVIKINGLQVIKEQQNNILNPSGGATIDSQARTSINQILNALKQHGLIASV